MLIPLRTDAPLYHAPWATIGIIVLNVVVQIWATSTGYEYADPFFVEYGSWVPHQWITSVFLHAGWLHLIGNMVFLWVFGLVVEGKIGWWRFLLVYLGIALVAGLIEQTVMLGAEGGSLGASGVIFGLIAIAMVWAPENEIDSILLLYGVRHIELSIKAFAAIYLVLQIIGAMLSGFGMGSAMLHLLGAGVGLPVGLIMLKRGWVDCEGWDWFSRRDGRAVAGERSTAAPAPTPAETVAMDAEFRASFCELVQAGSMDAALSVWQGSGGVRWGAPVAVRERLANQLVQAGRIAEAQPFIDGVLSEDPGHPAMGLVQAQLLIKQRRPAAAQACLDALQPRLASERQRSLHAALGKRVAALQAEGVLELDP